MSRWWSILIGLTVGVPIFIALRITVLWLLGKARKPAALKRWRVKRQQLIVESIVVAIRAHPGAKISRIARCADVSVLRTEWYLWRMEQEGLVESYPLTGHWPRETRYHLKAQQPANPGERT
jgi:hypothetical protein